MLLRSIISMLGDSTCCVVSLHHDTSWVELSGYLNIHNMAAKKKAKKVAKKKVAKKVAKKKRA